MMFTAADPIIVGGLTAFNVQLNDNSGAPVSAFYDAGLQVSCVTDVSAPPSTSFCQVGPFITPLGAGAYLIQFSPGTIW